MSSMRSASSNTKTSTSLNEMYFCLIKSSNLPGVAIKISTPLCNFELGYFDLHPQKLLHILKEGKLHIL